MDFKNFDSINVEPDHSNPSDQVIVMIDEKLVDHKSFKKIKMKIRSQESKETNKNMFFNSVLDEYEHFLGK